MSEKNSGVKNLIEAHSWLGVIISVVLFIVFWAGSIVLFVPEIQSWAEAPAHPVEQAAPDKPLQEIVESVLEDYPLNREEHLTIVLANEQRPYHQFYIDLLPEEGYEGPEQVAELKVDPKTGEVVGSLEQFHLMDFLYVLHYNMHLPAGIYLVGLVTLVFMILIFTGVYIHARKVVSNFFLYRKDKKRNKLLDIHNVVGVMSLPFTFMYALSGLIFNLAIIYQIAFAVFLYQGNSTALLEDAGYISVEQELSGEPLDMGIAYELLAQAEQDYGQSAGMLRFYNYGDANAVIQLSVPDSRFARYYEPYYRLADASLIEGWVDTNANALRKGIYVLTDLHFGSFAGLDLRILYFLLGLGVCGMIVAGNLLWLDKRAKQGNVSPRGIALVGNLTLGGCCGTLIATAVIFLAERILPLELDALRGDWLARIFVVCLLLTMVPAFLVRHKQQFLRGSLLLSAVILGLTLMADWIMYGNIMGRLWAQGYHAVIGVEAGLLVMAALSFWIAGRLTSGQKEAASVLPERADEMLAGK